MTTSWPGCVRLMQGYRVPLANMITNRRGDAKASPPIEEVGVVKDILQRALDRADVDYCEIRLEESDLLNISFRGRGLEDVRTNLQHGGNVRALQGGGWGFSSFCDFGEIEAAVDRACRHARLAAGREDRSSCLAPVPAVEDCFEPDVTLDPAAVVLAEKVRILTRYRDLMLNAHERVAAANITYKEQKGVIRFANTDGTYVEVSRVDVGSNLVAMARRGDLTVASGTGFGSSRGLDCLLGMEEKVEKEARLAVDLLDAPQVTAGTYPVVCDPALAGLFVHEAFGHLSEGDNVYKNPDLAETMRLGRRLGRDILSIYDTGEYFDDRGALKYDDEGVQTERTYLVEEGILSGRLHSRETAGLMGEEPTGNARAIDFTFPPICRMRSTCIDPGTHSFDEMISDIELGVYAVGSGGGQTNGEMFTFNAGHAYMIRDGRVAELVRDVKLMGNVFTTLANIDMVGDDPGGRNGAGGCGKGGQSPLPTSGKCPHIRIQNVIVGGAR